MSDFKWPPYRPQQCSEIAGKQSKVFEAAIKTCRLRTCGLGEPDHFEVEELRDALNEIWDMEND